MVPPWLAGSRLDQGLACLAGISRRRARTLIGAGQLWLDAKPTRTLSRPLALGSVLDLLPPHDGTVPPRDLPAVEILFEDPWLVAVSKPSGVAAAAPRVRTAEELTIGEALQLVLSARRGQRREVMLVHRLDRPTSGLILFALHPQAARGLAHAWRVGAVSKRYLAVIDGEIGDDLLLDQPIARDPLTPGRFIASPSGRPACTRVRLLSTGAGRSLVEVQPLSGRSHQIRVHLAAAGRPIAGDVLYAGSPAPRLLLHAWRLDLPHPQTGAPLSLEATIPREFFLHLERCGLTLPSRWLP